MKKYFLIVMLLICFLGYGKNENQKTENTEDKKVSKNRKLKNLRQDLKRITVIILRGQTKQSYKLEKNDKDVFKVYKFYFEDGENEEESGKEFFGETTKLLSDLIERIDDLNYGESISKTKKDDRNTYTCSVEIYSKVEHFSYAEGDIYGRVGCSGEDIEYGGTSVHIFVKKIGKRYYISDLVPN